MQQFFNARDNCDENFLFAYNKQTVMSIYIGAGLGKPTVESAVRALITRLETDGFVGSRTIAQLCGTDRLPERIFGMSIDSTGDLAAGPKAAWEWSMGRCVDTGDFTPDEELHSIKVWDISGEKRAPNPQRRRRPPPQLDKFHSPPVAETDEQAGRQRVA
ncbi:hypothetical protein VTO42DRAFT_2481 [Malbranchea cinnamomea]